MPESMHESLNCNCSVCHNFKLGKNQRINKIKMDNN